MKRSEAQARDRYIHRKQETARRDRQSVRAWLSLFEMIRQDGKPSLEWSLRWAPDGTLEKLWQRTSKHDRGAIAQAVYKDWNATRMPTIEQTMTMTMFPFLPLR